MIWKIKERDFKIYIWEELESFKLEILQKKISYLKKKARFKKYIYEKNSRSSGKNVISRNKKKKKERDFKNKYMRRTRVFETRETQVWGLIILSGNFVDCVQVYKFFPREIQVFKTRVLCKFYLNIKSKIESLRLDFYFVEIKFLRLEIYVEF